MQTYSLSHSHTHTTTRAKTPLRWSAIVSFTAGDTFFGSFVSYTFWNAHARMNFNELHVLISLEIGSRYICIKFYFNEGNGRKISYSSKLPLARIFGWSFTFLMIILFGGAFVRLNDPAKCFISAILLLFRIKEN